jgi:hypothetical protein
MDAAATPLEQAKTQILLQIPNKAGNGRLGYIKPACGIAHRALLHDGTKGSELFGIHESVQKP